MNELLLASSGANNFGRFIVVLIAFVFVLFLTYWTTVWIANFQKSQIKGKNIEVIEISRISNNKYIEIVRVGDKYVVIAVSKDTVTKLLEVDKEQLEFTELENKGIESFDKIYNRIADKIKSIKQKEK